MIYRDRFGQEYDLSTWPKEHLEFLRRAYWHYANNMRYEEFAVFILGSGSPVLDAKKNGPIPTRTPLYEVATDLEFRLGVKQGQYSKDWEGEVDPEWSPNE
jgi:hypothetical protein